MRKFESPELKFYYPENWSIYVNDGDEHTGREQTDEITLQSPGSSQLTIALYGKHEDSEDLLQRTLDALKAEYEDLEIHAASSTIGDEELSGFDVTFFYLDLLVIAELRIAQRSDDQILLLLQSESRELDANRDVFSAIIFSMLNPEVVEQAEQRD